MPKKKAAKAAPVIQTFSKEELLKMLAEMAGTEDGPAKDMTVDLATGSVPAHLIADKSALPPPGERTMGAIQAPAKAHIYGDIRMMAGLIAISQPAPVGPRVNPFTYISQVSAPISPPPSRNFK